MMRIITVREFANVSYNMELLRKRYCNSSW